MIILDTNIVSELSIAKPDRNVSNWINKVDLRQIYLCTPVVAELSFGAQLFLQRTGSDRHQRSLDEFLLRRFSGRILSFDIDMALSAGALRARRVASGRPVAAMDMVIAAIAKSHNATLATRNIRDFDGLDLKLINPFEA